MIDFHDFIVVDLAMAFVLLDPQRTRLQCGAMASAPTGERQSLLGYDSDDESVLGTRRQGSVQDGSTPRRRWFKTTNTKREERRKKKKKEEEEKKAV